MQRVIKAAQKDTPGPPLPPPTGSELKDWDHPPEPLSTLLSALLEGKKKDKLSDDSTCRITSKGRDIVWCDKSKMDDPKAHTSRDVSWHLTGRIDIVRLLSMSWALCVLLKAPRNSYFNPN